MTDVATTDDGRTAFDHVSDQGTTLPGARTREMGAELRELDEVRHCSWFTLGAEISMCVKEITPEFLQILDKYDAEYEVDTARTFIDLYVRR